MQPHYNNDTNINDLNDIAPNKNTNVQIAAKKKLSKIQNFSKEKTLPGTSQYFRNKYLYILVTD